MAARRTLPRRPSRTLVLLSKSKKHTATATTKRGPTRTPVIAPLTSTKRVSVAGIFKSSAHSKGHKKVVFTPIVQSSDGSSSPLKKGSARKEKKTVHPLAANFKVAARVYRAQVYMNAKEKLDKTYESLVNDLHNYNIVDSSSPANAAANNTLKLTIHEKFDNKRKRLYNPIGDYNIRKTTINENGEPDVTSITLRERLSKFEEAYKNDIAEINTLQEKWNLIVAELYKTGLTCLDEETMASLFTVSPPRSYPTHFLAETQAPPENESLFVSENDSILEPSAQRNGKKQVSFQEPAPELPAFLLGPPKMTPVAHTPSLEEESVRKCQSKVAGLGSEQVAEFRRIEEEHQRAWKKKMGGIVQAMADD